MNRYIYLEKEENRKKGLWLSFFFHLILLLFLILPFFNGMPQPNPDQPQGILVAFGNPDLQEVRQVRKSQPRSSNSQPVATKSSPVKKTVPVKSKILEEKSPVSAVKKTDQPTPDKDMIAKREAEEQKRKKEEQRRAEEAARKKAEEEARRRAEQKAKAKSKFSNMFGGTSGDASESKGLEKGKPDASALSDLSSGSGRVGTGLGSRELLYAPTIEDNTQKTGRVIVNICVNPEGKVISAKYQQRGSTTTDAHLIGLAERNAAKYKFSKSKIQEQCGSIIIDFKLK